MRLLLFLLLAAAGAFGAQAQAPDRYPAELAREFAQFPPAAAGFTRARVFTYAPGIDDISVGYYQLEPQPIIATLYFYKGPGYLPVLAQQFEREKATIEQTYAGALKTGEETLELSKGGRRFQAHRATYRYVTMLLGARQEVTSEVMVWSVDDHYVKLRSTARSSDGAAAAPRNRELLDAIDWTRPLQ